MLANLVVFAVCFVLFVAHSNPMSGEEADSFLSSADQEKFFVGSVLCMRKFVPVYVVVGGFPTNTHSIEVG